MDDRSLKTCTPARISGLALFLWAASLCAPLATAWPAAAAPLDDHQETVAALADVKAAINELVRIDASYSTDRNAYRGASQRAINLLVGEHGSGYLAGVGVPSDPIGAIGHVDALLDRKETPVWAAPLHGAEANMRGAVSYLQDSLKGRELTDYQIAASRALTYLEVARGRPTETGVLGGLEGALANTLLGVPAGAKQVDACQPPSAAPAYGTHNGYLAWVAVPGGDGPHPLDEALGGTELVVRGGFIVVHTALAPLVSASCDHRSSASAQTSQTTVDAVASHPVAALARPSAEAASHSLTQATPLPNAAEATPGPGTAKAASQPRPGEPAASAQGSPPALYTEAQAEAGGQIFAQKCVSCHGANLQGTAAPSVAGNDFLQTARRNGWTLAIIRYLVVNNMPLNSPSSLSPEQYASVMAFLLASNCYPAGTTLFPTSADPAFAKVKLGPVPGEHQDENSLGVCKVD
jgi:polar amino acid transport system substrate-binding protein